MASAMGCPPRVRATSRPPRHWLCPECRHSWAWEKAPLRRSPRGLTLRGGEAPPQPQGEQEEKGGDHTIEHAPGPGGLQQRQKQAGAVDQPGEPDRAGADCTPEEG